jgi:hypothetical protein
MVNDYQFLSYRFPDSGKILVLRSGFLKRNIAIYGVRVDHFFVFDFFGEF